MTTPTAPVLQAYTTRAEVKAELGIATAVTTMDTRIDRAIDIASRSIDRWTGTHFYTASEVHYYTARNVPQFHGEMPTERDYIRAVGDEIAIEPCTSVTELATDWTGTGTYDQIWVLDTDYHLRPYNAPLRYEPYTLLERPPLGSKLFPWWPKAIRVTGTFGWCDFQPRPIQQAALIVAVRYLRRPSAPLGVLESTIAGGMPARLQPDPDVADLLEPYTTRGDWLVV